MRKIASASFQAVQKAPRGSRICAGRRFDSHQVVASQSAAPRLILYSKSDCHLCHGLKDKISGVLSKAKYMPSPLTDADLEVRDITTNEEWERQYGMVIPVLKVVLPGTQEEVKVRRVPPRSSAEKVAEHILQAMESGQRD